MIFNADLTATATDETVVMRRAVRPSIRRTADRFPFYNMGSLLSHKVALEGIYADEYDRQMVLRSNRQAIRLMAKHA